MAGVQDYWEFYDDFLGGGTFGTAATENDPWVITDTSAAGAPTYTRLDHGETAGVFRPGVAQLLMAATSEVENVCLSWGDKLSVDFNSLRGYECGIRLVPEGTLKDATTTLGWGVTGDRNDAIDSIAVASLFRLAAATGVNTVVVESDDTVTNNDDAATGYSLTDGSALTAAGWAKCKIDFSDKTNVKYFIGNAAGSLSRVAAGTTFDMSGYSAGVQPFFQIQKTASTATDAAEIDYVRLWGVR